MTLRINSQGKVSLTVPKALPKIFIDKFLLTKEEWIRKKLEERSKKNPNHSPLKDGGIFILGTLYSFTELEELPSNLLQDTATAVSKKEEILRIFLHKKSKEYIEPLVIKYLDLLNLDISHISYKIMKTRWGSCNSKKKYLNFNSILISSPPESIEYIVVHEIAHILHPHHGKEFWELVENILPDWRVRRKKLIFYEI